MSPWQFSLFRILFGTYLAVHFLQLVPYAGELFGAHGIFQDPSLNPSHGLFPNPLDAHLPDFVLRGILFLLGMLSILFASGIQRHAIGLVLWFGWTALFHRNNLIANPSLAYVGLMLLLSSLIPRGEPLSLPAARRPWAMPVWVFRTAWILLAAGYSFSGWTKLSSPSWLDGSALHHVLYNPLARPGVIRETLLALPDAWLAALTWATLASELLFLPLALWSRTRPWIWLAMILMHLGILGAVDFADLSLGMILIHLFTFDPEWLSPKGNPKSPPVLAFDGDCLLCSHCIRFLAHEDRAALLRFTPLQGNLGRKIRQQASPHGAAPDSMLLRTDGGISAKSDAVLSLLSLLGGHWRVLALAGHLIPQPIRDAAYDWVASRRYRWFGKSDTCQLPDKDLLARIID